MMFRLYLIAALLGFLLAALLSWALLYHLTVFALLASATILLFAVRRERRHRATLRGPRQ